ncbi:MAG: PAS domain S-box protein [Deltaproteobacteria bacterium]|nr:PAS domain S-box protein [Deltaproteobacteria bacterium]
MKDQDKSKDELISELVECRRSLKMFKSVFDQAFQYLGLLQPDGTVIKINQAGLDVVKARDEDVVGQLFWETSWWRHSPAIQRRVRDAVVKAAKGEFVRFEVAYISKQNQFRCIDFSLKPVTDGQGRIIFLIPEGRDITDSKQIEKTLRLEVELRNSMIETLPAFFISLDQDGSVLTMNATMLQALSYSFQEVVGADYLTMFVPERDRSRVDKVFQTLLQEDYIELIENIVLAKDGRELNIEWRGRVIREEGKFKYFFAVGIDVTERKRAIEALRASEEQYRLVMEASPDPITVYNARGEVTYINPAFVQTFGWAREELLGRGIDFVPPHEAAKTQDAVGRSLHGESTLLETQRLTKDGRLLDIQLKTAILLDRDGRMAGNIVIYRDITEHKRAEAALRENEEKYRVLTHESPLGIAIIGSEGSYKFINPKFTQLLGYTLEDVPTGKDWFRKAFPDPEDRARALQAWINWPKDGSRKLIWMVTCKDGTKKDIQFTPMIMSTGDQFVLYEDITERRRAEEDLRQSRRDFQRLYEESKKAEDVYKSLLNFSPNAIIVYNMNGEVDYVNPAFTQIFGWTFEELKGKRIDFVPESERQITWETVMGIVKEGKPCIGFETKRLTKDGSILDISISGSRFYDHTGTPAGMLAILHDVTEAKRIETRLRQAQKMEAVGVLAGGIAHDFNNILAAIMGFTEMAAVEAPEGGRLRHRLERVLQASHRAKELVRQILTFSRQTEQEKKPVRLSSIVREALKLLRASIPSTIEIRQDIQDETGVILADPTQIHQILMNLCTNSGYAMRDKGGTLRITLSNLFLDNALLLQQLDLKAGHYIRLTVGDTGHGMDQETQERIFEPFFTTKPKGQGTGMGLAVVHGLVKSHDGAITVYSELGQGTTFHVYFPRLEGEVSAALEETDLGATGGARILFVDDEDLVVEMGTDMLKSLGYRVVAMTNSVEALKRFGQRPGYFDLIITDQTMPNLTGAELAREVLDVRPDMPIILCSGFSETISYEDAKKLGIREFVMKPLTRREMAAVIKRVLEGRG